MPQYSVLGGHLRSALEFPELPLSPGSAEPTWTLDLTDRPASSGPGELLGSDPVRGAYAVAHFRTGSGYRLVYGDTGTYDITESGSRITWHRPSAESRPWEPAQFDEAVRIDVLGRVMASALHAQGIFCLHGSAVRIGGRAIGFLAPRFSGKSTLAFALVAQGAGLITDDTLAIELDGPGIARPGVHHIRMWPDSTTRLAPEGRGFQVGAFGKLRASALPPESLVQERTPLATLYLLVPAPADGGRPAVERAAIEPRRAALSLVQHAKIGPLLGKSEAARLLGMATRVSESARVEVLRVMRDFDRLEEVVAELLRHHGG